jgi:hypothetical protein
MFNVDELTSAILNEMLHGRCVHPSGQCALETEAIPAGLSGIDAVIDLKRCRRS